MGFNKTLMVIGVLLLASVLAEGDAHQKAVDQKTSADVKPLLPPKHGSGWGGGGGGWGGWGGGGWGGGGHGGGWGGWGGGGRGGGWGGGGQGGGWGGGGHGGGWGGGGWGGGGCGYRCGHRCCTPQEVAEIKKIEEMNSEGRMRVQVNPETVVGTEGHGGDGGYGGGGGYCHYWCGRRCCSSPEEMANFKKDVEMTTREKETNDVKPESRVGPRGYGGGGGWGGGGKGWGGGGGGWGGGGGGWGGGGGGGCHYWCGRHCCTPEEIANNPELNRSENKNEAKVDPSTVKQGEVKN